MSDAFSSLDLSRVRSTIHVWTTRTVSPIGGRGVGRGEGEQTNFRRGDWFWTLQGGITVNCQGRPGGVYPSFTPPCPPMVCLPSTNFEFQFMSELLVPHLLIKRDKQ